MKQVLAWLGSMKLAVVLLLYLGVLTFAGTLMQQHLPLHEVQKRIFEGWAIPVWWYIAVPGAYPVLMLLAANLLVGGVMRLRLRRGTVGILITHLGIALLLAQGFVKLNASHSGMLPLYPGESGRTYLATHEYELALLTRDGDQIDERTVPAGRFAHADDRPVRLQADDLPFVVEVSHWLPYCQPMPKGPMVRSNLPVVRGAVLLAMHSDDPDELQRYPPGCYVKVRGRVDDKVLADAILFSLGRRSSFTVEERMPFMFTVDGREYGLDLRPVTADLPFEVRVDEFVKADHPGTKLTREFSSYVTVTDAAGSHKAHITMNAPLRKDGFVLYQASWGPPRGGPPYFTSFEVARNPSDRWSIWACSIIGFGLTVHFLRKLYLHLKATAAQRRTQAGAA